MKSAKAFERAKKYIAGGVNSPVRAFKGIGRPPLFIQKARGPYVYDISGRKYIDHCLSWGVHLLGHNHTKIMASARKAMSSGTSFGAPTILETELAERITGLVPSIERIRFVNSGTEAVMSALRLARAFTKRDLIVKFDGCYHGHADHLLVAAGSGLSHLRKSSSEGIPESFLRDTISLPFNDFTGIRQIFERHRNKIAAVIVEPVPANMGVIIPRAGYLGLLRELTEQSGALLIFDEVITGFRWHKSGAQGYFGIHPDLTVLGKIIGGGFPAGAFGGRKDIMKLLAPQGPVYQAGTLSGNPVAMAAGAAVMDVISRAGFYEQINKRAESFFASIAALCGRKKISVNFIGTMFSVFFNEDPVGNYAGLKKCDAKKFARFYRGMLDRGIYLSPSQSETNFISSQHTSAILGRTAAAAAMLLKGRVW